MARVGLPPIPESSWELEDYVAGMFQAAGYYVEKNVRQRQEIDVLELDAVATSYDDLVPTSVLAEVKGGRWGFPDLFKLLGWMRYLGIPRGGFFVKDGAASGERDLEPIHRTLAPFGVSLVDLGHFQDPSACLRSSGLGKIQDSYLLDTFRLASWVERTLLANLRRVRRSAGLSEGTALVLDYHDLINDHVFFAPTVLERLSRLYGAYKAHPKLSLTVAAELAGERAPLDHGPARPLHNAILADAIYRGEHPALQACFYVEHRARLSILKAAIDLLCLEMAGNLPAAKVLGDALDALPSTFHDGLRRLRGRPSFRRYALLWQHFLWGLGGFYMENHEGEELGWLCTQTGIPREEINRALGAFDDLFPLSHGTWMVRVRGTSIRLVKMVPLAFRGVGAVQRLRRRRAKDYDAFAGGRLNRYNLIHFHNSLVRLLAATMADQAPGLSSGREKPRPTRHRVCRRPPVPAEAPRGAAGVAVG